MSWKIAYTIAVASLVFFGLTIVANSQEPTVSDVCLRCICEAVSGCNLTKACFGNACGLFHITWDYWADGGKLAVPGESPDSHTAFANCVNDPNCAASTVQNYMLKYKQDCNGDNVIDCQDFASLHKNGAFGCQTGISGIYATTLNECLQALNPSG